MGEKYRDTLHDREGTAIAVYEYLHGCARINLEWKKEDGSLDSAVFDIGQLVHAETGEAPARVGPRPQMGIPG